MKRWFKQRLCFWWVTASMVLCSILFFPWFLPRETVSGLAGRWCYCVNSRRRRFAIGLASILDLYIHPFVGTKES